MPVNASHARPGHPPAGKGLTAMRTRPLYDVVALLARVTVGIVFIAHGWQKIEVGVTETSRYLDGRDVPLPTAAAIYATFTELLGGLGLILGLGLPVVGIALFLDMAGAFVFVHAEHGIFLVDQDRYTNGFELALVLGLASLLFAAGAGGRFTLDNRIFPRGRASRSATAGPARSVEETSGRSSTTGKASDSTTSPLSLGPGGSPGPTGTPSTAPRRGSRESPRPRSGSASGGAESAPAAAGSAPSTAAPRLAAEVIADQDVTVAGKKKPRRPKRRGSTQPAKADPEPEP